MEKDLITVAYCANNNYTIPLCCSIKSLITNCPQREMKIHILYSKENLSKFNQNLISFLQNKKCKIEFVQIEDRLFSDFTISTECKHTSKETYFRFVLPEILTDTDKILYLDCDTIVLADISELFDIEMENSFIAGVDDYSKEAFSKRLSLSKYLNAGVLLFNLKKMRDENMQEKLFQYSVENIDKLPYQDQDVLNIIFQNGIIEMDSLWNIQLDGSKLYKAGEKKFLEQTPKIIHYISSPKPWEINYKSSYKKYFFNYLYSLNFALIIKYLIYRLSKYRKEIIYYSRTSKTIVLFKTLHIKIWF